MVTLLPSLAFLLVNELRRNIESALTLAEEVYELV